MEAEGVEVLKATISSSAEMQEQAADTAEESAPDAETAPVPEAPVTAPLVRQVIRPPQGWIGINWAEIWRYRELLYFLSWRDVKVRYKQTVFGAAWAILNPFLTMIVFTVFFGRLAGLESKTGGVPYPIYVYTALLPWTFFSRSIGSSFWESGVP